MADYLTYERAYAIGQAHCTSSTTVESILKQALPDLMRPEVLKFALLMEANLRKHDADRGMKGWEGYPPDQLLNRLDDETQELYEAIELWKVWNDKRKPGRRVASEAADVANFAMMIADVVGGLDG